VKKQLKNGRELNYLRRNLVSLQRKPKGKRGSPARQGKTPNQGNQATPSSPASKNNSESNEAIPSGRTLLTLQPLY
jgi:hypothetical protein